MGAYLCHRHRNRDDRSGTAHSGTAVHYGDAVPLVTHAAQQTQNTEAGLRHVLVGPIAPEVELRGVWRQSRDDQFQADHDERLVLVADLKGSQLTGSRNVM